MKRLRIIVGCESSGIVAAEFRRLGHYAWSCDFDPCERGPEFHIQMDIITFLEQWTGDPFDLGIFHPPCDDLAVCGARWFRDKRRTGRQIEAAAFFVRCVNAPNVNARALENPVGVLSTAFRNPDQIIQPWEFGHPENKKTCLWLYGIPPLKHTRNVKAAMKKRPIAKANRIHHEPPGHDRKRNRSRTFRGIARAMAVQWSQFLQNQ